MIIEGSLSHPHVMKSDSVLFFELSYLVNPSIDLLNTSYPILNQSDP
jgi:hypothetical protein